MILSSLKRSASLVDEVCQQLAQEIRNPSGDGDGRLPPERELAERLGVSRPVVREATKRLELQGLLEVRHGVGTRVVDRLHMPLNGSLSLLVPDQVQRLQQSLEVRRALEPEAVRWAVERASAATLKELKRVHRQLEGAKELGEAVEADMAFHRALAKASGNDMFALILDSMADLGRESRHATISYAGVQRAIDHHAAILEAVLERNAAKAVQAMQKHLAEAVLDLAGQQNQKQKPTRVR